MGHLSSSNDALYIVHKDENIQTETQHPFKINFPWKATSCKEYSYSLKWGVKEYGHILDTQNLVLLFCKHYALPDQTHLH